MKLNYILVNYPFKTQSVWGHVQTNHSRAEQEVNNHFIPTLLQTHVRPQRNRFLLLWGEKDKLLPSSLPAGVSIQLPPHQVLQPGAFGFAGKVSDASPCRTSSNWPPVLSSINYNSTLGPASSVEINPPGSDAGAWF